jgi:hypothetical protein
MLAPLRFLPRLWPGTQPAWGGRVTFCPVINPASGVKLPRLNWMISA